MAGGAPRGSVSASRSGQLWRGTPGSCRTLSRADHASGTGNVASGLVSVYRCRVNFDAYAHRAVDLVNAPMDGLDDLHLLLRDESWMREEASDRDVATFRRAQKKLREVFDLGAGHRDMDAVEALNALLETHPIQPRISGHDAADRHMPVTTRGASAPADNLAGAPWGPAASPCRAGTARAAVSARSTGG